MAKIDTTLLDLDRAPTLDELKAFFKSTIVWRSRNTASLIVLLISIYDK